MKQDESEKNKKNSKRRNIQYIMLLGIIVVVAMTIFVFRDYKQLLFCQIAETLVLLCVCYLGSYLTGIETERIYEEKIVELESENKALGKENEQLREFIKNEEKKPKKRKISSVGKND